MRFKETIIIALLLGLGLTAFSQDSLRYWADKLEKTVGTSVEGYWFNNNYWLGTGRTYNKILYGQFNGIVAGNEMKMDAIHPEIDVFDFVKGDIMVDMAEEYDMLARGHTLVWHSQNPAWFEQGEFTRDSLLEILEIHITTIVTHFKGKINEWDVVNEAMEGDGTLRQSKWYKVIGPEYIDSAFVWAHRADPDAILILNDYGAEGLNSKSNGMYDVVKKMVEKGIPIHGIGMQAHLTVNEINFLSIEKNMERFNKLGLLTNFTEVDIRIPKEDFNKTQAWNDQAKSYVKLLNLMLNNEQSTTFIVWAFSDADSWIPNHTNGTHGQACIYDFVNQPKPAYFAMLDTLKVHNGVVLGISEIDKASTLKIVPNPASNYLNITSENQIVTLNIYDVNGRKVKSLFLVENKQQIGIEELEKGMYIIEMIDNRSQKFTQKFIKN